MKIVYRRIKQKTDRPPKGAVLMFTLVILLLMSLMGAAILLNSRTELNIAANTVVGRDTFTRADGISGMATLLTRISISKEFERPEEVLANNSKYMEVEFREELNLALLQSEHLDSFDIQKRYIRAGSQTVSGDTSYQPHMIFSSGGSVVGTAAVSFDFGDPVGVGQSLSGDGQYDNSGGTRIQMLLVVSVNGRSPGGDASAYDRGTGDVPHSFITTIFREVR